MLEGGRIAANTRARLSYRCESLPVLSLFFGVCAEHMLADARARKRTHEDGLLRSLSLVPITSSMAEAPQRREATGERRAAARAQIEEDGRRTRQRLDDLETRLDSFDSRLELHEMRLNFLESHIKVVLRGFDAIPELFRAKDSDFCLAKASFIAAFVAVMKENTGAEANAALAEAKDSFVTTMACLWLGIFPTGGQLGQCPDAIPRRQPTWACARQPTWACARLSYLLTTAAKFLVETRQVFTDRARKPKRKGKGKGAGKGNPQEPGRKGNKVRGKGKAKAPGATPKMTA